MENNIIQELIDMANQHVKIKIAHLWYGNQNIICTFLPLYNDMYFGFIIKRQIIRILNEDIQQIYKNGHTYCITSELMNILITPIT